MFIAIANLAAFVLLTLGLGAALAPGWALKPGERLCMGIGAALVVLYLAGFGVFAAGLNPAWFWCLPPAALSVLVWRRQQLLALLRDAEIPGLLGLWGVFALWTLGLLSLVVSYSGGGWAGDWLEHYQRTLVFMQRADPHMHFLGSYTLTSRPPLANAVTALFMEFSPGRFADYQLFTTLLSTLFFFPGWLFYQRWKEARGANTLWAVVLMLNPMVAQNTTFAWTKLTCTFWILSGSYFLLRGVIDEGGRRERITGFLCLTAGMITHYSAGPWILAWLAAYGIWWLRQCRQSPSPRELAMIALPCALLAFTWFGWAGHTFGWQETGTSNSVATEWQRQTPGDRLLVPLGNVFNTLVPHPFRSMDKGLIAQVSVGGRVRDYFFNIYQTNLPLAAGFSGLLVCLLAWRRLPAGSSGVPDTEKRLWRWFMPFIVMTGILVHTPPDDWGVAHICLQPLVIMGLAWISGRLPGLPTAARVGFILLLLWDVGAGIVMQFLIEARTFYAGKLAAAHDWGFEITRLTRSAWINYEAKSIYGLDFFAETIGVPPLATTFLLLALLALMVVRGRRQARHAPTPAHAGTRS